MSLSILPPAVQSVCILIGECPYSASEPQWTRVQDTLPASVHVHLPLSLSPPTLWHVCIAVFLSPWQPKYPTPITHLFEGADSGALVWQSELTAPRREGLQGRAGEREAGRAGGWELYKLAVDASASDRLDRETAILSREQQRERKG